MLERAKSADNIGENEIATMAVECASLYEDYYRHVDDKERGAVIIIFGDLSFRKIKITIVLG